MNQNNYGEPWTIGPEGFTDANHRVVGPTGNDWYGFNTKDEARVLACVNACRNIPDDWLEFIATHGGFQVNQLQCMSFTDNRRIRHDTLALHSVTQYIDELAAE